MDTESIPPEKNPDPLTGEPGAHPVGTGLGAATGGAAGAVIGGVGGPVGVVAGAAVGALIGGLAGKSVAESLDPTAEETFWRENYRNEPYYNHSLDYGDYAPAFRAGYLGYAPDGVQDFAEAEEAIKETWMQTQGNSRLAWDAAKHAARAGFDRVRRPSSLVE